MDIDKLTELVRGAAEDIEHCETNVDGLSPAYRELGEAIEAWILQQREAYRFISSMADGNLDHVKIPSRHNYFAGPGKDLYYKLKHLTWQAQEVAGGDYSQRVDFMGSFSDSFNYMITELEKRELQIKHDADEKLMAAERQNQRLKKEMERQLLHYRAYREYVSSFTDFRDTYKDMMGEVYALFKEKKYDEGRLLVAKINDKMASDVVISRRYSNNDIVDAALMEIADSCKSRRIKFSSMVYVPEYFTTQQEPAFEQLINYTELVLSLLTTDTHSEQKVDIMSSVKNEWLSVSVDYYAGKGSFPDEMEACLTAESMEYLKRMRDFTDKNGCIFNVVYRPEQRIIALVLHAHPPKNLGE